MATLTLTNLHTEEIYVGDLYLTIPVGETRTVENRAATDINAPSIASHVTEGKLAVSVTLSAAEIASGVLTPDNAVEARDVAAAASSNPASIPVVIMKDFAAGGGGAADDVTIYAVNTLPYKIRIYDAVALISAGSGVGRSLAVRSAAAGGGTLVTTLPATANGPARPDSTNTASVVLSPGASVGLFVRRSDSAIAGEIHIMARREQ